MTQSNATNPLYQKGQSKEILGESNGLLRNGSPVDPQAAEQDAETETEGDQTPKQ